MGLESVFSNGSGIKVNIISILSVHYNGSGLL